MDGEIRPVMFDAHDAFCFDHARMVVVAKNEKTIEYRTFPDAHVRILAFMGDDGPDYFEAFFSSGNKLELGKTPATKPLAIGGRPRAWLASKMMDPRGHFMTYGYCFAQRDGYTAEYALQTIRHSGFQGTEPTRAITLVHSVKDAGDVRTTYSRGMAFQHWLQLDEIQMLGPGNALVRRYPLAYETSETTGRTRLTSVKHCGANGECTAPTRIQYPKVRAGFEQVATTIDAPLSKRASFMLADFNGDGIDDLLTPDTTVFSTPTSPSTQWTLWQNSSDVFAAPKVAFSQEWSFAENAEGPSECSTTIIGSSPA